MKVNGRSVAFPGRFTPVEKALGTHSLWGGRGLVRTLEKCKISALYREHNPTIPQPSRMPNNIPRSSLFLWQLF